MEEENKLNTDDGVRLLKATGVFNDEQAFAATKLIQILMGNESD